MIIIFTGPVRRDQVKKAKHHHTQALNEKGFPYNTHSSPIHKRVYTQEYTVMVKTTKSLDN